MVNDSYYLTPHEAALAVVATGMKKSRLKFDTLVINSAIGGILFSSGGMLHVMVQASPDLVENNIGIVHLLQGLVYPIGLFYVVIMGAELFNSNVLFFTVGLLRGAVGVVDLLINWIVSWLVNLGANLFVCYVICYLGGSLQTEHVKQASVDIVVEKAACSFVEVLIRGIACNFYVCLAIYLQIMCRPLHVKFLMMVFPVFTFVLMGYSHTVADMFLCPMGIMNGAPVATATYIWRILVPESIGNIIGGSVFGVLIPYYSHMVVVERDSKAIGLPSYDARDEQPELMMDSRVIRTESKLHRGEGEEEGGEEEQGTLCSGDHGEENDDERHTPVPPELEKTSMQLRLSTSLSSGTKPQDDEDNIVQRYDSGYSQSARSLRSRKSNRSVNSRQVRSPPGVFPVLGMGEPLEREKTIASGYASARSNPLNVTSGNLQDVDDNDYNGTRSVLSRLTTSRSRRLANFSTKADESREREKEEEAMYKRAGGVDARDEYLGNRLIRKLTRSASGKKVNSSSQQSVTNHDLESQIGMGVGPVPPRPDVHSAKTHQTTLSERLSNDLEKVASRMGNNHTRLPALHQTRRHSLYSSNRNNNKTPQQRQREARDSEERFAKELADQGMTERAFEAGNDVVGPDMDMRDILYWSNQARRQDVKEQRDKSHNVRPRDGYARRHEGDEREKDNGYGSDTEAESINEKEVKKPEMVHQKSA